MQFTNPTWLWGFWGLLIPVAVHLLSRKEGKIIKIGSVRYLEDTVSKQFKSIRLNELILLALRCLLITILVLFLAGLQLNIGGKNEKWLLIESGIEDDPEFSSLVDSLQQNGFEVNALAEGFPQLIENLPAGKKVNYWNLVDELETESLGEVVVLSYNYLEGFKGKRPLLPDYIRWISKAPDSTTFSLNAIRISKDSIEVRRGNSNPDKTVFLNSQAKATDDQNIYNSEDADSVRIEFPDTISVAVVTDSSFARDATIMVAALRAIDNESPNIFRVEKYSVDTYSQVQKMDWVIWLSERPLPVIENLNVIYYQAHDTKNLWDRVAHSWVLTKRLSEGVALEENLTVKLALILNPREKYAAKSLQSDRRVWPEQEAWSEKSSTDNNLQAAAVSSNTNQKYLSLILLLLLIVERWISFKRNQ